MYFLNWSRYKISYLNGSRNVKNTSLTALNYGFLYQNRDRLHFNIQLVFSSAKKVFNTMFVSQYQNSVLHLFRVLDDIENCVIFVIHINSKRVSIFLIEF